MKKKVLLLGVVVTALFVLVNVVSALTNISSEEENDYDAYLERNYERAILSSQLQERFYNHYGIKKLYEDEYPEYFGGIYISDDANSLIIQVVKEYLPEEGTDDYNFYNEIINMDDSIEIEYVDNSFNKLISINQSVANYMTNEEVINNNVAGAYIDVMNNSAVIELYEDNDTQKEKTINSILKSSATFNLSKADYLDGVTVAQGEKSYAFTDVNAGGKITIPELGSCSMGYRVKYNGANGFVTAGHCVDLYNPTEGVTKVKHFIDNSNYDYAFVQTYSNYTPTNKLANPGPDVTKLAVVNYCVYITTNMAVAKSGNKTGYTTGKVTGLDQTVYYDNFGVNVKGLVKTNVKSDQGDSGSPVFIPTKDSDGGAVPIGILNAGTKGVLGIGRSMYFTSFDSLPYSLQVRY